mgnify:CR=1 FL=1
MNGVRASHSPWDRGDFRRWGPPTRRLWLHLLTGPRSNLLGCRVLPVAEASDRVGGAPHEIDRYLARIEDDGRILRDPDTDLVLIRRYLDYRPLGPGDRRRAARLADALPRSETVLAALRRELTGRGGEPGRLAERVLADRLEGAGNEEFPWRRKRHVPGIFRERVRRRDGGRCVRCGSQEDLTVDHVRPFSRGGPTVPRNLQLLCKSCNSSKSAHTMEEWTEGG